MHPLLQGRLAPAVILRHESERGALMCEHPSDLGVRSYPS